MDAVLGQETELLLQKVLEENLNGNGQGRVQLAEDIFLGLSSVSTSNNSPRPHWAMRRILEFGAGRRAARQALGRTDARGNQLPVLSSGKVQWPPGFQGSISHCCHLAVAVVSPKASPGVDVERVQRFSHTMIKLMCSRNEMAMLEALQNVRLDVAASVIFSAKEAAFKSLTHLDDAHSIRRIEVSEMVFRQNSGSFSAVSQEGDQVKGYFALGHGAIISICL